MAGTSDRAAWFRDARFGMFVHWGLYSLLGRGEWVRNRERIPMDEYARLADRFDPKRYDPHAWARLAKRAGMKYMVLTTKHHDGFCLFDTKTTDFNSVKTAAGRDLVAEFVKAARAEGLKVGLYFSMMDWSHPECLPEERMKYWDGGQIRQFGFEPPFKITPAFYKYLKTQITELLTRYGKIDVLWHDGTWGYDAAGWRIAELNRHARKLQAHILFTDRAHKKEDIASCEQQIRAADGAWEACMTLNDNWGYCARDTNWKNPYQVVSMLLKIAEKQGCLLLNVGPRPDGAIPAASVRILEQVGRWTHDHAEALYRIGCSPFSWSNVFFTTVSGRRLYLHLKSYPGAEVRFGGLATKVRSARLLPGGEPLQVEQDGDVFVVKGLPAKSPDPIMPVVRVDCAGPIEAC